MAQTDGLDPTVFESGPGIHRHRIGVVEEKRGGGGHLANILAEGQHLRDIALPVHDAAGAERIADALINPVFERDVDIEGEGVESADPRGVEHIVGPLQGAAPIGRDPEGGGQSIGLDIASGQLGDHIEVVLVDIVEGEFAVGQFGHRENIAH